ncbi:MAG: tRNA pseudouridine(55) synthase TruB [Clostridia bacterium]|nr:tRNA pseudouridine(55) synthase TruB [Clostridia bacterium]
MGGILCIDKPAGMTSFDVVSVMRRLAGEKKIGHAGTLDPMATGVLPLFLGAATRAVDLLPSHDKAYIAGFRLGITTDTGDITGEILTRRPVSVSRDEAERTAREFVGEQLQRPPMYSAVRVAGRHLYELARKGVEVERAPRAIRVYELTFACGGAADEYTIAVKCSKGTYIRTLCGDIGERLGCGAVMTSLRRTMAAGFTLADCITLDEARRLAPEGGLDGCVRSLESAFVSLPEAIATEKQAARFFSGGPLLLSRLEFRPSDAAPAGNFRVKSEDGVFLGLARADTQSGELKILLNRV